MKLSSILLFVFTLHLAADGYSQNARIRLDFNSGTISEIIDAIENQTSFKVFYKTDQVDVRKTVKISQSETTLSSLMDQTLEGSNLTYMVMNNLLVITPATASMQMQNVKGVITDAQTGEPLPGVNVVVEGTTIGVVTDLDGKYSIDVASSTAILTFSYIGYTTQKVEVAGRNSINIALEADIKSLEEVIVVGYGVQKKSVVTASIAKVTSEDLKNVTATRIDNTLKGLASGVSVTTESGQPGSAAKVRIRGTGTINNSDPLYIVDGMPVGGGIDYLNPSDIQSIEVLKDAASGAVYGARAANGVILITTKNGSKGKVKLTYDVSKGYSNPWKEMNVLNATEYALLMNEGFVNQNSNPKYADPYSLGEGTNWQKEVFNYNAPQTNHQLSLSGGTEKASYYVSAGYLNQEGIVGGDWKRSNYERLSLRTNAIYNVLDVKDRNYLNKFTIGLNLGYTRITSGGIGTNSEYGSVLGSALAMSPLLSVYASNPEAILGTTPTAVKDPRNGKLFTIPGPDYNELNNPLAMLTLPGDKGNSDKFVTTFWGEVNLWENLKFKSTFGTDLAFWGNDGWTPKYYLGKSSSSADSKVWSSMNRGLTWQVENVLSYDKSLGKHNIQVMLGQSAQKYESRYLSGNSLYLVEEDPNKANIDFTTGTSNTGARDVSGSAGDPHVLASVFGRISYNFSEKYMIQGTIRRDGSSNFGPNNKYAIFPSVSLGWNLTNENFMSSRPAWLSSAKLRGSWGKNGNENIGAFQYAVLTNTGNNYAFGSGEGLIVNGTKASALPNPDVKWEESIQTNAGLDLTMFSNSLNFTFDYYVKKTKGMLKDMVLPSYVGESTPDGNVGDMENSGVEFEASYKIKVSDVNFRIGANASYIKNELTDLGGTEFLSYDYYANVGNISRAELGQPFPFFYGLKTNGIFQNMQEVSSYVKDGALIQPNAKPGDVRFVDLDDNGVIDDKDRTMIGKGMPDWTYGVNLNMDWKGFDFNMFIQGTVGNSIFNATRRTDLSYINLPGYMLDRWTGEGTSNKYPRFTFTDNNQNWQLSDIYISEGDYMRLKNLTIGYTLPSKFSKRVLISSLRVYFTAENLLTFTKYNGFDPEISSGGTSTGIDRGVYPQARTFTFGVNLSL